MAETVSPAPGSAATDWKWPWEDEPTAERDPLDETTWSADERRDFLGRNGFEWAGGEGPTATWIGPDGKVYSEYSAFTALLGPEDKEYAGRTGSGTPLAVAQQKPQSPDRITQGGVVYERGADGQWKPAVGIPQQSSGGMTAAQSAQLGLDREKFTYQQERDAATMDAQARQQEVANQQWMAEFNARSQQNAAQMAIAQANLDFARNKEAFAQANDNKRLAMQAESEIRQYNFQIAKFQTEQANLNAQMQFQVQRANQEFEGQKQDRLANIATQLGTVAQDPGDRGKLATTLTALGNRWGAGNEAAASQNYVTDDSLVPTESLLRTQQQVQSQASPFTFTPVTPPMMPMAPLPAPVGQPMPTVTAAPAPAGAPGVITQGVFAGLTPQQAADFSAGPVVPGAQQVQAAASGGILSSAMRKVGERGPETEIDLADGRTMVFNETQKEALRKAGLDLDHLEDADGFAGGGISHYAEGGIFGNITNVQDSDRTLSRKFLQDSIAKARGGTPWPTGALPSPVFLSSPGTNPYVASMLASLKALEQGIPADFTLSEAARYRPQGMGERVIGRSR